MAALNFLKGGISVCYVKKLREENKLIRLLVNFQKSPWYPALFAALCVFSGTNTHEVYIPVLWLLTAFVVFSVLFTDDNKVFLTPLLMIFFGLGTDVQGDAFLQSNGDMLASFNMDTFPQVIIMLIICLGSLFIKLVADGSVKAVFKRKRMFTVGILAMDAAFILNGLFGADPSITNLGYGAVLAMGFTVVYFLVSGMLESSEGVTEYACYAMTGAAYIALLQILTVAIRAMIHGKFIVENFAGTTIINRHTLVLSWGVTTVVAAVFVLGIPAVMYLARTRKFVLFSYVSSILFILGALLINARAAVLVGAAVFFVCCILCCIKGKNAVKNRIYTAVMFTLGVIAVGFVAYKLSLSEELMQKFMSIFRIGIKDIDSGRFKLWENGWNDFLSSPVFGIGFENGGYAADAKYNNFFSNMYHCVFVQVLGSMGSVGAVALVLHLISLGWVTVKKFSIKKLLILFIPFTILLLSLLDNFFFYLHFQIFYGVFLAVAERMIYAEDGKFEQIK